MNEVTRREKKKRGRRLSHYAFFQICQMGMRKAEIHMLLCLEWNASFNPREKWLANGLRMRPEKRPKTKDQTCVVKFRQCRRTWLAVSVGIWQNGRSWGRFLSIEFRLSALGRLSRIADQRNDFIFWNRRSVAGRFYLVWLCPRSGLVMMTGSFKASEHWKKATWKGKKDEVAPCWQGRWHHGPGSQLGPRRLLF